MKNKIKNYLPSLWMILIVISSFSCKDDWDNHYYNNPVEKSSLSLSEYIKANPDSLSIFSQMLKIAKYDTVLNQSQVFTVWAPLNNALQNIDLTDTALVVKLVKNHIARYNYPTSVADSQSIVVVGNKLIRFSNESNGYSFGNVPLAKSNMATRNGIIHYLNGYVPYQSAILEYINQTNGLDSLKSFIAANEINEFSSKLSKILSYDAQNRPIYDSVFIHTNRLLKIIGKLDSEDSTYTVLLPNNTAWIEALNRIKTYYNTLPADGGKKTQYNRACTAMVTDMAFSGRIEPAHIPGDSLISTCKNVFYSPSYLFDEAQKVELSNGVAYITDLLRFKSTESWFKSIQVEAENTSGRVSSSCDIYTKSSLGTLFQTSKNKYIQVEPNTTSSLSKVFAEFSIPNTLSASYNIYCVFVPTGIITPGDLRPSKVRFYLSYVDASGNTVSKGSVVTVNGENQVLAPTKTATIFETDPTKISKMLVAKFQFPYSNILTSESTSSNISVKLRVENATSTSETVKYNRTMRIDCIILEPVE